MGPRQRVEVDVFFHPQCADGNVVVEQHGDAAESIALADEAIERFLALLLIVEFSRTFLDDVEVRQF